MHFSESFKYINYSKLHYFFFFGFYLFIYFFWSSFMPSSNFSPKFWDINTYQSLCSRQSPLVYKTRACIAFTFNYYPCFILCWHNPCASFFFFPYYFKFFSKFHFVILLSLAPSLSYPS